MTEKSKEKLKKDLIAIFSSEQEIKKIILFGSFIHSDNPNDLDIAIFQNSNSKYLELALKYRKLARSISKIIPLDIFPIRSDVKDHTFLEQIEEGVIIYEK